MENKQKTLRTKRVVLTLLSVMSVAGLCLVVGATLFVGIERREGSASSPEIIAWDHVGVGQWGAWCSVDVARNFWNETSHLAFDASNTTSLPHTIPIGQRLLATHYREAGNPLYGNAWHPIGARSHVTLKGSTRQLRVIIIGGTYNGVVGRINRDINSTDGNVTLHNGTGVSTPFIGKRAVNWNFNGGSSSSIYDFYSYSIVGWSNNIPPPTGGQANTTPIYIPAAPFRTNYRFDGWELSHNGGYVGTFWPGVDPYVQIGNWRSDNIHVDVFNAAVMTAQWTYIPPTYNFTASVTSGSGTVSPTSGSVIQGGSQSFTATPSTGWYTSSWSGVTSSSGNTAQRTNVTTGFTVGVSFAGNPYTFRFNANGGTGTMGNQSRTWSTGVALSNNTFLHPGHEFLGWAWSSSGEVAFTNSQNFATWTQGTNGAPAPPGNNTTHDLYAIWKPLFTNISFNPGTPSGFPFPEPGTITPEFPATVREMDKSFTLPNAYTISNGVWKQIGWTRTEDGIFLLPGDDEWSPDGEFDFELGKIFPPSEDDYWGFTRTFYAVWEYTLTKATIVLHGLAGHGTPYNLDLASVGLSVEMTLDLFVTMTLPSVDDMDKIGHPQKFQGWSIETPTGTKVPLTAGSDERFIIEWRDGGTIYFNPAAAPIIHIHAIWG